MRSHSIHTYIFAAIWILLTLGSVNGQGQEYFLDIPSIPGGVTTAGYEDQICVSSFSYGVVTDEDSGGTGRTRTAARQLAFRLGKGFDRASPRLFDAVARQPAFSEVTLTAVVVNSSTGERQITARYVLQNVVITSFETGGSVDGAPKEVIAILVGEVEVTHFAENGSQTTAVFDFDNSAG